MKLKEIKITAPIGKPPRLDPELKRRIEALPENTPLPEFLKTITDWEDWADKKFRGAERRVIEKGTSGMLSPWTTLCRPE